MSNIRFGEELQALIDYGHDCCARVDDRIHEYCQRIREAHDEEIGGYQIALTWKDAAPLPQYDVLGNERHKAVCELRKSDFTLYTPEQFVSTLYKMLHGTEGFPANIYLMQKGVRDRLIYLLGGDTVEVEDGVDAERCGDTSAGGDVRAAAGRVDNCDGNRLAEEVVPITQELREHLAEFKPIDTGESIVVSRIGTIGYEKAMQLCDVIDAVHKSLERENKELRHDVEMWRDRAEDMRMERDDALKEHHAWAPESHYMMLPKDADGEPIHVGDVVEWADGSTCEVVGIGDGGTLYYMDEIEGTIGWTNADGKHHHHAPTVEDVLTEFGIDWEYESDCEDRAALLKKYAAKLRLADDGKEQ